MVRRLFAAATFVLCLGVAVSALASEPSTSASDADPPDSEAADDTNSDSSSDEDRSKREAIRRLLNITGTPELGMRIAERIVENIKRSHPDVPDKFWNEFEEEMTRDEFIGIIVPLYDEHFSQDEIQELITFFKTDVGQKYVENLPELSTQSMQAGRRWGQKLGQRIVDKLQAKGYE